MEGIKKGTISFAMLKLSPRGKVRATNSFSFGLSAAAAALAVLGSCRTTGSNVSNVLDHQQGAPAITPLHVGSDAKNRGEIKKVDALPHDIQGLLEEAMESEID